MFRLPIIMAALVIITAGIRAQEGSPGQQVTQYLESLAMYDAGSWIIAGLADEIDALLDNPVNINDASEQELSRIFFLTIFQVKSLAQYVRTRGNIISAAEIAYIPGFDSELAKLIEPFIRISNSGPVKKQYGIEGRLLANMITKSSYSDTLSPGSPIKALVKTNISSGNINAGITMEKDQGEPLFVPGRGADFMSGYLSLNNQGLVRNIILGDFRVRLGQGLVTWTGYSSGTSPLDPALMKSMPSISAYSSSDENNFFRGAAVTAGTDRDIIMLFVSRNNIDASVTGLPGSDGLFISSLNDQGLHNSQTMAEKKDVVAESSAGFSYNRNMNRIHTGFNVSATGFSIPFLPGTETESYFDFSGGKNIALSFDHSLSLKRSYFYGEGAWNPGGGFAFTEGVRFNPAGGAVVNILYTNILKGYNSFHGMVNGRETVNNFRESLLTGFSCEPAAKIRLSTGLYYMRDHWYGLYGSPPVISWKFETEARYAQSENLSFTLGVKQRLTNIFVSDSRGLKQAVPVKYSNIRINALLDLTGRLRFQSRAEFIFSSNTSSPGFMLFHGVKYTFQKLPASVYSRVYVWSTPGYDSRIYAWEDDLLYSSSILPYYYSGSRSYLILTYGSKMVNFRLKFGFNLRTGNDNIYHSEEEIKMQVIIRI